MAVYRKPYREWVDRTYEFFRGYKMPDFRFFNGEREQSTIEHVTRFTTQCGEFTNHDFMKLRLFPNSLSGVAFAWYTNLPVGSILTWQQMKDVFHAQLFQTEPEVSMADLSRLSHRSSEKASNFITRFKRAKHKYRVNLPETEFVNCSKWPRI